MTGDPKGRRAFFESVGVPPRGAPDDGRRAFYSVDPGAAGGVSIHCSRCEQRTNVSRGELARRVMALSVWAPGRRNSRWITCPACKRRAWCRVQWW